MPYLVEVIFLGTGTSEGIPRISCLCNKNSTCKTCPDAYYTPQSKNKRRNTNLLVRYSGFPDGRIRNIVVDCGKFFWQSAMDWFVKYNISQIDAILLTHTHNDACFGLDDLRDWTQNVPGHPNIPIYLTKSDLEYLRGPFQYLMDTRTATGGGGVASLHFKIINEYKPLEIEGITIIPLPVHHGDVICLGFRFEDFVYISDVKVIPDKTRELIQKSQILVIDALRPEVKLASHLTLEEALNEVEVNQPKKAFFVGMNHELEHESTNRRLVNWCQNFNKGKKPEDAVTVELAYDGQHITYNNRP